MKTAFNRSNFSRRKLIQYRAAAGVAILRSRFNSRGLPGSACVFFESLRTSLMRFHQVLARTLPSLSGIRPGSAALATTVVTALLTIGGTDAQEAYPNRPIKLIVPFAAGGNTDAIGRVTASSMEHALKVSVIVENRPGAGGIVGTDAVVKSPPDGYTLCVCGNGPLTVTPWTEKVPYDPLKDLVPISLINTNALVLIVNLKVEAKTAADLVALSHKVPGGLSYSTVGAGGLVTFSAEIFRTQTKAKLTAVPYRGGALATTAVVAGDVQLSFANMSDAMGQIESKGVRPLAVTTAKRSEYLPDIPTLVETGLVSIPVESWNGLFAPAGTPKPIVDQLAKVMADMARDPEVRKRMATFGSSAVANTPSEYAEILRVESGQWEKTVAELGLKK
jgi:tripartite-type tricarboxylate transporter receptor subunit TctC